MCHRQANCSRRARQLQRRNGRHVIGEGVLSPWGIKICLFPMLSSVAYTTSQGYCPTCDELSEMLGLSLLSLFSFQLKLVLILLT